MKILTLSGSTRSNSLNLRLLEGIALFFPQQEFIFYKKLDQLPLFRAEDDKYPWAESVLEWRKNLKDCDVVIISIPEYIHNLPALIKNGCPLTLFLLGFSDVHSHLHTGMNNKHKVTTLVSFHKFFSEGIRLL